MDDHHIAQADPGDDRARGRVVPDQDVAVAHEGAAVERHGEFDAAGRLLAEAVLLRLPVIEGQRLDRRAREGRKLVKTGTTKKGDHDDWGYHVYLTNVTQNNDGTQTDTTLTGAATAQAIVIKKDNAQIGLHLLGSVNYNATKANLDEIAGGLERASRYLFDVTDGQMFFERSEVFEDGDRWDSADIQYFPNMWPNANGSVGKFGAADGHVYMPGPGFDGGSYTPGSWLTPNGFRTFTHEFGHHAFGAWDEYKKIDKEGNEVPSSCTLDRGTRTEPLRASFMDHQFDSSEMCADKGDNTHNADTIQGQFNKTSVWGTFAARWSGSEWTLRTPITRNAVNPGPNMVSCTARTTTAIKESAAAACAPLTVQVTLDGNAASGMPVVLHHGNVDIEQGTTDANGNIPIYGAATGDTISVSKLLGSKGAISTWFGETTVRECAAPTIELIHRTKIIYYLMKPIWRLPKHEIEIRIPIEFDPMMNLKIAVELGRNGQRPIEVPLNYDQKRRMFAGTVPFESGDTPSFQLRMTISDDQNVAIRSTATFEGVLFHSAGPGVGPGGIGEPIERVTESGWELISADHPMGLSVGSGSFPNGTSVTIGRVDAPIDPPMGLVIAGGPYSVEADGDITDRIGVQMAFDSQRTCGLTRGTTSVYHLVGDEWMPVDTEIDEEHHVAYAAAKETGLYAVMAAPANDSSAVPEIRCGENLQFTVPAGSRLDYQVDPAQAKSACGDAVVIGKRGDGAALDSSYPVGKTTIEWTAKTAAGKTASCTQEIVVTEEPPVPAPACGGGCCCEVGGKPGEGGASVPWIFSIAMLVGLALRTRARR